MRRGMLFAAVVVGVGAVLALPGFAAAQAPTQDSVVASGTPTAGAYTVFTIDATSGPSGENPTGQVSFDVASAFTVSGPVTCLAVSGNAATVNIQDSTFG